MKSKILKFLTLAAAFCGMTAWGATVAVTTQDELVAAVNAANSGDTITLSAAEYTLYGKSAQTSGKALTFVGAVDADGNPATTWKYGKSSAVSGEGGADYSFDGSGKITFKNVILQDNYVGNSYYRGFVRAHGMDFENCKITNVIGYLGDGPVSFKNCKFETSVADSFNVKTYSGTSFVFDGCEFKSPYGFIDAYRQNTLDGSVPVVVNNCTFIGTGSSPASKPAVRLCDYTNASEGGAWGIALTGNNTATNIKVDSTTGTNLYGCRFYTSNLPLLGTVSLGGTYDAATQTVTGGQPVWSEGAAVEAAAPAVAKIGTTEYSDLAEAIKAAIAANNNVPVELLSDIDLTDSTWTSVVYNGGKLAIDGKGFTVKGLTAPLLNKQGSGGHELTMSDITFKDATISTTEANAAVIVPYADSMNKLSFTNVTIDHASVTGSNYAGAFVGYAAGYNVLSDGPVFQEITFDNCTVKNSTITGGGSTGALMGHAAGNVAAKIVVTNGTTVKDNTVTCTGSSTNKAGSLFGTVGAAGDAGVLGQGGIEVAATVSGNTVKSGSATVTTIYGRQGTSTGVLTLQPGGSYDAQPIADVDAAWAAPAEGYVVEKGDNNLWGVEKADPRTLGYEGEALPAGPDMSGDVVTVTPANIQYVLDGAYGSIDGKTIHLSAGTYDQLVLGRPTKYAGSNTEYRHGSFANDAMSYSDFIAYKTQPTWTEGCYYTRAISNVKFTAEEGVTVPGVTAVGGQHIYGSTAKPIYDYVRDNGTWCPDTNNGYFMTLTLNNIEFDGLSFTKPVALDTSSPDTVYDGVAFKNCAFTTGGTASANGAAIHYYNENNNGKVRNLVVDNCTFTDCYQGVYTAHVTGITVKDSEFANLGHNAIAIQDSKGACNHGAVVITDNEMTNVGDRAIRFNNVAAGTTITITGNTATYKDGTATEEQSIKATSLAEGVATTVELNNWNNYGVAANKPLMETVAKIGTTDYKSLEDATEAAQGSDVITIVGYTANMTAPDGWKFETADGVTTLVRKVYVAQIGETKYESLQAAINAAEAGQTITMLADIIDDPTKAYNYHAFVNKNVTIDMDGHKMEGNYAFGALVASAATVTIKNGTIKNNWASNSYNCFAIFIQNSAQVTLDNVVVRSPKWCVYLQPGSGLTVQGEDSDITAEALYAIYAAGNADSETVINLKGGVVRSVNYQAITMYANDAYADGKVGTEDTRTPYPVVLNVASGAQILAEGPSGFGVTLWGKGAELNMTGGEIRAKYSAIAGNGSHDVGGSDNSGTKINISGGTVTSTSGSAIYHPQHGTLAISGGSVTGVGSAVEVRAGDVNISGGSLTATASGSGTGSNTSGTSVSGAALAISQHTTQLPINVTITGGTFTGTKAVYEVNPQGNPSPDVTLTISDGTFYGEVSSVDCTAFISGGMFDAAVPEVNCAEGYVPSNALANGLYTVVDDTPNTLTAIVDANTSLVVTIPEVVLYGKYGAEENDTNEDTVTKQNAYINNTVEANGLKVWQNYVMGVDGSNAANKLTTDYAVGAGEMITVKTPISAFNAPADSGITVTYRLLTTRTPEADDSWTVFAEGAATPEFPVNLATQTGDTYWKIEAVFTGSKAE